MAFSTLLLSFLQRQVEQIIRRVKKRRLVASWAPGHIWAFIFWTLARAAAFGMPLPCPGAEAVWLCGCRRPGQGAAGPSPCWGLYLPSASKATTVSSNVAPFPLLTRKTRDRIWALTDSVSMAKRIVLVYGSDNTICFLFCCPSPP